MKCVAATDDATALLEHAMRSLPEDTELFDMVPAVPTGFLLLAHPIQELGISFVAFWWATDRSFVEETMTTQNTLFLAAVAESRDMWVTTWAIRPGRTFVNLRAEVAATPSPPQIHPDFGEVTNPPLNETLFDLKTVVAFNLLLAQQVVETEEAQPSRQMRRQAARHHTPLDPVVIVQLPVRHHSHANGGGVAQVDWSHRWIVSGHWRKQWYSTDKIHRPKWIAPHIKGPDDKPLVVKEKLYIFDPPKETE